MNKILKIQRFPYVFACIILLPAIFIGIKEGERDFFAYPFAIISFCILLYVFYQLNSSKLIIDKNGIRNGRTFIQFEQITKIDKSYGLKKKKNIGCYTLLIFGENSDAIKINLKLFSKDDVCFLNELLRSHYKINEGVRERFCKECRKNNSFFKRFDPSEKK